MWVLTRPSLCASISSGLFFISLVVEKSVLLVFRLFSEMVVPYVAVVLVLRPKYCYDYESVFDLFVSLVLRT